MYTQDYDSGDHGGDKVEEYNWPTVQAWCYDIGHLALGRAQRTTPRHSQLSRLKLSAVRKCTHFTIITQSVQCHIMDGVCHVLGKETR